jgi:hypothetical protein
MHGSALAADKGGNYAKLTFEIAGKLDAFVVSRQVDVDEREIGPLPRKMLGIMDSRSRADHFMALIS